MILVVIGVLVNDLIIHRFTANVDMFLSEILEHYKSDSVFVFSCYAIYTGRIVSGIPKCLVAFSLHYVN